MIHMDWQYSVYIDDWEPTDILLKKNTGVYANPNTLPCTLCFAMLSVHFGYPSPCNATSSLIRLPVQIYIQYKLGYRQSKRPSPYSVSKYCTGQLSLVYTPTKNVALSNIQGVMLLISYIVLPLP